ncbi:hypothetical protein DOTSEDRAFT_55077 [Dothistroma septosporum NZE10]|uniref:RING-type domain-containing protein n=1 Tax=Dothistroma septosporum (strain NZE10 / CBS 128990) TaxID=675120 RepID=N1PGE4_DOTSN|nr:hypothetical protein DOTSEDRAFT_55077 [Dothistroma septosporum NZE10]
MALPNREQYFARLTGKGSTSEADAVADECPVCYEEITTSVKTTCNHVFCEDCLKHWLSSSTTCPSCRSQQYHPNPRELVEAQYDQMLREFAEGFEIEDANGEMVVIENELDAEDFLMASLELAHQIGAPPSPPRRILPASPRPALPGDIFHVTFPASELSSPTSPGIQLARETLFGSRSAPIAAVPPQATERPRYEDSLARFARDTTDEFYRRSDGEAPPDVRTRPDRQRSFARAPPLEPLLPIPIRQDRARAADRARNVYDFGPPRSGTQRRNPLNMIPRHQGQGGRRNGRGR